jgi:hypothetical protein
MSDDHCVLSRTEKYKLNGYLHIIDLKPKFGSIDLDSKSEFNKNIKLICELIKKELDETKDSGNVQVTIKGDSIRYEMEGEYKKVNFEVIISLRSLTEIKRDLNDMVLKTLKDYFIHTSIKYTSFNPTEIKLIFETK